MLLAPNFVLLYILPAGGGLVYKYSLTLALKQIGSKFFHGYAIDWFYSNIILMKYFFIYFRFCIM